MTPISTALALLSIKRTALRDLAEFRRAVQHPREAQRQFLLGQVGRAAETAFGRDHGFGEILSLSEYRRRVPIGDYASHAPYIERVMRGETGALFHPDERVLMFALTSGTTQARKFIPVTQRVLEHTRRMWRVWGFLSYAQHRAAFGHGRLAIVSDWDELRSPSGLPCGAISGMMAHSQNWVVRRGYVLPSETGKVHETDAKYYLAWRLGLERTIGTWVSPNPGTLLSLARFGSEHADRLLRDLFDGRVADDIPLPDGLRSQLAGRLRPQRLLARRLMNVARRTGGLKPRDVWPELQLLGCWTGGTVSCYLKSFPEEFGSAAIRDLGLIASEGRMTLPIADGTSSGALEILGGFYEFVPVEEMDRPQPVVLESHELQEGKDYFILLTNASGLYRYNIRDVVRCTGWLGPTPLLAFLNKGSGVSDLAGEKLTEHQVVSAVSELQQQTGRTLGVFSLAPCWDERQPYYALYLEGRDNGSDVSGQTWTAAFEAALRTKNMGYAEARDLGRLGPVRTIVLPNGFWNRWDEQRRRERGGPVEQYKHPCLISDLSFSASHAASL